MRGLCSGCNDLCGARPQAVPASSVAQFGVLVQVDFLEQRLGEGQQCRRAGGGACTSPNCPTVCATL